MRNWGSTKLDQQIPHRTYKMSKIRVKNFGPIKKGYQENNGWLDIKKVTVFIGNQGSGKSTVAKLISTFTWIEKALVRGDYDKRWFERKNKLKNQFLTYHRLENYFKKGKENHTAIEYQGDRYTITFRDGSLQIEETKNDYYALPQIMYVPAERNFISYVKTPKELKLSSDSLKEFLTEFDNAKSKMRGAVGLPINKTEVEYDRLNDTMNLKGQDYKVKLTDASSGFQSLVPLYLVSAYLANTVREQSKQNKEPMSSEELERFKKGVEDIWSNSNLTNEQKRVALSVLSAKFNKTAFINIVEEPEQNLFPTAQWETLKSLLTFNNMNKDNKLIVTTHSPYIINFLNIAIQAASLKPKIDLSDRTGELLTKLESVVPVDALVSLEQTAIYEMDEGNGEINKLSSSYGIPSDKNYLNNTLRKGNLLFDELLKIEELC